MEGRVQKTFHYKVARYKVDGKRSLEDDLLRAVRSKRLTKDRFELQEASGVKEYRLINSLEEGDGQSFGVVIGYTEGVHQAVVAIQDDAEFLDVQTIAPRLEDPAQRAEFMNGLLYFGVKRNHLVILASQQLTLSRFEQHVNWILGFTRPGGERVLFSDPVAGEYREKRFVGLKAITFETEIEFTATDDEQPSDGTASTQVSVSGLGMDLLENLFKGLGLAPPKVDFMGGIPPHELVVTLDVRAKGSRAKDKDGRVVPTAGLDAFALALRNIEDGEIPATLEFKDSSKLSASDLKLRTKVSVEHVDGVLKASSVRDLMSRWFTEMVTEKVIDP